MNVQAEILRITAEPFELKRVLSVVPADMIQEAGALLPQMLADGRITEVEGKPGWVQAKPPEPLSGGIKGMRTWYEEFCMREAAKPGKRSFATAVLAADIAFRAHTKDMTVYVGSELLAERTGIDERQVKRYRKSLIDDGWLVDTGSLVKRAKVYRLAIPPA